MAGIAAPARRRGRPSELPRAATGQLARPQGLARFHHRHSLCLAAVLLPSALLHHLRDQLRRASRHPALHLRPNSALSSSSTIIDRLFTDNLYFRAYLNSRLIARIATFFSLLIGYPMALGIARARGAWRNVLLLLVILPFWTSFLLRVYAWIGLLGNNSWFNRGLTSLYNTFFPCLGRRSTTSR